MDVNADLGQNWVSGLAWKGDYIVGGNTLGEIHVWNTKLNKSTYLYLSFLYFLLILLLFFAKSRNFNTSKGVIKRINFSPSPSTHQIMVLFSEGDIGIWDLDHGVKVSASSYLKGRDLKAVDCDWISESIPVVGKNPSTLFFFFKMMNSEKQV